MQQDDKKQIYIGPTIQHIQSSQFLTQHNNNLLLLNKRQLHLLNLQSQSITTSKIDSEKVSSSTVHQLLNVYLIKTHSDIYALNQAGQSLGKIVIKDQIHLMQSRFIFLLVLNDGQCQDPHQRQDKLIYITDQNLHISNIKITFQKAILKNKRITNFNFQLIKQKQINPKSKNNKNNSIDPTIIFDAPQWIQKCKIFKQLGYFICYNNHEIMVYKIPKYRDQKLQPYLTYKKTSKIQNPITDIVISQRQKQIIFSHQTGIIKIYRFNQSKKYLQQLKGHQKQCHSLYISNKNHNDILYSSGYDNTIRIWNLYQFQEIYSLRIDLIVDHIILLSDQLAFIKWSQFRKSCLCKINAYKMEPIMTQNKNGKIINLKCDGQWAIILYSNNYAEMFLIDQSINKKKLELQQINEQINGKKPKNYIQKIQFPLKYGNVISAKKLKSNQYAIILQKGFSIITLNKDQIVSQNFQLKKLVYNQQISHMYSDSEPQQQDIDQIYNVHQQKQNIKQSKKKSKQQQQKKEIKESLQQTNGKSQQKNHNSNQKDNNNRLVELIHQKLLGTYLFGILQDWKGIPTAINVTFVTFIIGKNVPFWDMDQKKKNTQINNKTNNNDKQKQRKRKKSILPIAQQQIKVQQKIHVVLGTDRGFIYIVDIQNRVQFQSRIVMHTGSLQYIKEFSPKCISSSSLFSNHLTDQIFFMSLDNSKQICFWSLSQDHPPNIYCRVSNQRQISHLSLHNQFLLIGQKQGKISIQQIIWEQISNEDKSPLRSPNLLSPSLKKRQSRAISRDSSRHRAAKLYFKSSNHDSLYGHMKKVTTGDHIYYKQKNLFITGSEDCIIKLWLGLQKILLFELKIFDTIQHIRFLHHGIDFLMAHHDQVSIIKSKNIDQIKQIDHQLDTKYLNLPHFGTQIVQIKSFFNKDHQMFLSQLKKPNSFRLKMKHSLKVQPIQAIIDQPVSKTSAQGFLPNFGLITSSGLNEINQQTEKNENIDIMDNQIHLPTKINHKLIEQPNYYSPQSKTLNQVQKQQKLKVYAKSEQKIKARKSFHIASTAGSKQFNEAYFMLPKIMNKNSSNMNKKKASTSFQSSSFLQQIKTQRQKAFSYFARYSNK